jgi:hypothetical protein
MGGGGAVGKRTFLGFEMGGNGTMCDHERALCALSEYAYLRARQWLISTTLSLRGLTSTACR